MHILDATSFVVDLFAEDVLMKTHGKQVHTEDSVASIEEVERAQKREW